MPSVHSKYSSRRYMAALALIAMVAVPTSLVASSANETRGLPKIAAHLRSGVSDYASGGRWPGSRPEVCIEDASHGFPVAQAATEFEGTPVTFAVRQDCAGEDHVVRVVTVNRPEEEWAGWWDVDYRDDDHRIFDEGRIEINLAVAYRADPTLWRTMLVHELGHAAGLDHTHEGESIMHPNGRAMLHTELTDQDRAQLEQIYGGQS